MLSATTVAVKSPSVVGLPSSGEDETPALSPNHEEEDLQSATARSLINAAFEELEELSLDVEETSVYAVRKDQLASWGSKIRAAVRRVRDLIKVNSSLLTTRGAGSHQLVPKRHSVVSERQTDAPHKKPSISNMAPPRIISPYVSGAIHMLMDTLIRIVGAEWGTCFVYDAKMEELVLCCSVGKRTDKPGSLRLSAVNGIESHVLNTAIAVNVAHAYAEQEFRPIQDQSYVTASRTRSELVFPLMKPNSTTHTFGVIQLCNKDKGNGTFNDSDEVTVSDCAPFIAAIIATHPSDITNPNCSFDASLLTGSASHLPEEQTGFALSPEATRNVQTKLIFRTSHVGHMRRGELMRDAGSLPVVPSITEALAHVEKVHASWRNAVLLNMELEREIARLTDSLARTMRENKRLAALANADTGSPSSE